MSHFTETTYWRSIQPYESDQSTLTASSGAETPHEESLLALRRKLKTLNAWPEAGDTFLELLNQVRGYGTTLVPSDYDWLSKVADSAYKGEDIGLNYPSIFQKLLTFPDLRQQFLHTLHLRSLGT